VQQDGHAALAAECRTDPVILGRVRSALLGQLGGTMPAVPAEALGPSAYMDRRTGHADRQRLQHAGFAIRNRDARQDGGS